METKIFDNELDSARHLLKNGDLRASGAICGVVIETHFSKIAKAHNIKFQKKDPGIVLVITMISLKKIVYTILQHGDLFKVKVI